MYLRILFCCSIVRAEIEAHRWERKVTEHGGTKSPIFCSLSACASVRSRSIDLSSLACPSLSHACTHAHACTHTADPRCSGSGSLLFIQSASREQTAPWMPWPQMHRNSHNSLPDYKISGLWIWTQWLTAPIYQGLGSSETWSHRRLESQWVRVQGRWDGMEEKKKF